MKTNTFSTLFYIRRTKLLKNGDAPISMRITINGQRGETQLKVGVDPRYWNAACGMAKGTLPHIKELNAYLDSCRARVFKIRQAMEYNDDFINVNELLDEFNGKKHNQPQTILEIFRNHNNDCKKIAGTSMSPATVLRYETCYRHLANFIQKKYKKDDFLLRDIKNNFISDWEIFLKSTCKCAHNTTVKYLKNFKKIIRIALRNDWMAKDPFYGMRLKVNEVEVEFLEQAEFDSLRTITIDIERIDRVRDIFVFCCFTGLAFTDVKQLNENHIITDQNGEQWIRKARQKTKNICNIPILKPAQIIIDKYSMEPCRQLKGLLLPVASNQKMNAYLKEIADICKIKKRLTTHCARHTFATTVTMANNVPIEIVSKMLGHSSINMTRHYARVMESSIAREMKHVASHYSPKPMPDNDPTENHETHKVKMISINSILRTKNSPL